MEVIIKLTEKENKLLQILKVRNISAQNYYDGFEDTPEMRAFFDNYLIQNAGGGEGSWIKYRLTDLGRKATYVLNRLEVGDWIKHDIIGLGFYEIESISDVHINVKCLRLFMGKNPHYRNHVTNIHHGLDDAGNRIKIDQDLWYSRKVKRLLKNPNKCPHLNITRSDSLDECLDCGTKNY